MSKHVLPQILLKVRKTCVLLNDPFILSWLSYRQIKCCRLQFTCNPVIHRHTKPPTLQLQGFHSWYMPSPVVHLNPKQFNYIDCIFVGFLVRLAISHCVGFASTTVYQRSQPVLTITWQMFKCTWISDLKCRLVEKIERECERIQVCVRRKRKAERKPTIVCPGASGLEEVLTQTHFSETDSSI